MNILELNFPASYLFGALITSLLIIYIGVNKQTGKKNKEKLNERIASLELHKKLRS